MSSRSLSAVLVLAACLSTSATGAAPLSWYHFPPDCPPPDDGFVVACGAMGAYGFGSTTATCASGVGNTEVVKAYPPPSGFEALPVEVPPMELGFESLASPIAQGPGRAPDGPWVAIIDWSTWHGWSIGWIIHQIAGPATGLIFLDLLDPQLAPLGSGPGDAHVLAHLCDVVDAVDRGVRSAPQVVNLSLGRQGKPKEKWDGSTCLPHRLSCHVTRVLEGLVSRGTVVVGAAGNHRSVLFPAMVGAVLETGSLDLERLAAGAIEAGWETVGSVRGLAPGDGLCLRGGWDAPAGTSFASAVLSGWLAGLMFEDPSLDPRAANTWRPAWNGTCHVLLGDGVPYGGCASPSTLAVDEMLELVLDPLSPMSPCRGPGFDPQPVGISVPMPAGPSPAPRLLSHDQWVATGIGPTPAPDPCIPCMGSGGGGFAAGSAPARGASGMRVSEDDLVIDRSQSQALPAILHEVHLRVGDEFFQLDLSPTALAQLESGHDEPLVIEGGMLLVDTSRQPSLVYVAAVEPGLDCSDPADVAKCFWTSSPIDLVD